MAPILTNNCSAHHDYIQGVDFSPDGTFIAIAEPAPLPTTRLRSPSVTPLRDSTSTLPTRPLGHRGRRPAWINYAGEDSFYSIAIAGGVVYTGGHNRWVNKPVRPQLRLRGECRPRGRRGGARRQHRPGAAMVAPLTLRGHGTTYVATFPPAPMTARTAVWSRGPTSTVSPALSTARMRSSPSPPPPLPTPAPHPVRDVQRGRRHEHKDPHVCRRQSNSSSPGNPVDSTTCSNDPQQNWTVKADGTIGINGLCLGTKGNGTSSGRLSSSAAAARCHRAVDPGRRQQARQRRGDERVLTVPGGKITSGTALQIQTCSGSTSQAGHFPAALGRLRLPPSVRSTRRRYRPTTRCPASMTPTTTPGRAPDVHRRR